MLLVTFTKEPGKLFLYPEGNVPASMVIVALVSYPWEQLGGADVPVRVPVRVTLLISVALKNGEWRLTNKPAGIVESIYCFGILRRTLF